MCLKEQVKPVSILFSSVGLHITPGLSAHLAFWIPGPGSPEKGEPVTEASGRLVPGTQGFGGERTAFPLPSPESPDRNTSNDRIGTGHQFKLVKSEAKLDGKLPRQDSDWQRPHTS